MVRRLFKSTTLFGPESVVSRRPYVVRTRLWGIDWYGNHAGGTASHHQEPLAVQSLSKFLVRWWLMGMVVCMGLLLAAFY